MAFVPLTQKERDEAAVDYLRKCADRIERGEVLVEELNARIDFDTSRRRTRSIEIKEIWTK